VDDNVRRGYLFEQAVRELLPWSHRPPLAVSGESEQLDAFFEWNSWHFLAEAKAKQGKILRGSHDWEDFELKIRRRGGSCIGLFLSLFEVAPEVINAATQLNREGMTTIVLAGDFWDEAAEVDLPMSEVLRYMVANARSKFLAAPKSLTEIESYAYDLRTTSAEISDVCRASSATFLRRHKLERHEDLYVSRQMDRKIAGLANGLKPAALEKTRRENRHDDVAYTTARTMPRQICVIRDTSGAGKTTASVEIALTQDSFFGIARAAVEANVDSLPEILDRLGDGKGLPKLRALNRSLIYSVDSLDEAGHLPHKATEVNGLLRTLDSLNKSAREHGLLGFPVGLVFTVREDFWERWNAYFEGQNASMASQLISTFGDGELKQAFDRYSEVYGYRFTSPPSPMAKRVLAVPVNLLVFSEAHKFEGVVDPGTVLTNNVLALYFARKQEDVLKRYIPGFTAKALMSICGATAMMLVEKQADTVPWGDIADLVAAAHPILGSEADEVVRILVSEQILVRVGDEERLLRFRHARFVEYLIAHHIFLGLGYSPEEFLTAAMERIYEAPLISPYRVYDMLKHICSREGPQYVAAVTEFFASSSEYMGTALSRLRAAAGRGGTIDRNDLELVSQSVTALDPEVTWNAFFVLAARQNRQSEDEVLEAFERAWVAGEGRTDRWKLIQKLGDLGLSSRSQVYRTVLDSSDDPREWEVFLGLLLERDERDSFRRHWRKRGEALLPEGEDWWNVRRLAAIAISDEPYVRGAVGEPAPAPQGPVR